MAEEKEILRIGLDDAELRAKIDALEARLGELQQRLAQGGDPAAAQQAVQQEVAGLRALTQGTHAADDSVRELLRHKQQFAAVLNLVGGQLGPYVGQLGQLASLIAAGGPVAVGMAATAASVGLVVAALREMARASQEAREAEERRLAQAQSAKDRDVAATLDMAERMGRSGGGPEAITAAVAMREQLRGLAITGAEDVIPAIVAAGISDRDDAARLALLARSGARFDDGESARRALDRHRAEADALLDRQRAFAASDVGRLVAAGPEVRGMPALTDDEIAFRRLRDTGQLPPGVDSVEQMRRRLDVLERLSPALGGDPRARLRRDELTAAGFRIGPELTVAGFKIGLGYFFPGAMRFGIHSIYEGQWQETVRLRAARERVLGGVPDERSPAAPPPIIIHDNSTRHYYERGRSGDEQLMLDEVQD